jgi:hypothetical protein
MKFEAMIFLDKEHKLNIGLFSYPFFHLIHGYAGNALRVAAIAGLGIKISQARRTGNATINN